MRWYHWVGLGVLGLVLILFWIATAGRGPDPFARLGLEVDAINAKADVKRMKVELGEAQALAHVEETYREDLASMDEEKRERAKQLRKDPDKLAAFIVRGKT